MYQSNKRVIFILMAGIILLAACAPSQAAPTQDPAEVQQQIQEAVALTVAAKDAQQAQALAAQPTNTPLPTQTEAAAPTPTSLIPTATPFVVVPPTTAPSGGGGGGGSSTAKAEYSCDVIGQRPYDDTYFKPGDPFDVKWTIVNTGTKSWRAGLDLKYSNGPKMTGSGSFELPAMDPGDQYSVSFDAVAPKDEGYQVMVWALEGGICFPYVRIIVEN
ncbi:MAG: hypothetical protein IPP66_11525 [Anaerolineales bacterium]|nr:hypothetical protein [Anaerolineales bacterium]